VSAREHSYFLRNNHWCGFHLCILQKSGLVIETCLCHFAQSPYAPHFLLHIECNAGEPAVLCYYVHAPRLVFRSLLRISHVKFKHCLITVVIVVPTCFPAFFQTLRMVYRLRSNRLAELLEDFVLNGSLWLCCNMGCSRKQAECYLHSSCPSRELKNF